VAVSEDSHHPLPHGDSDCYHQFGAYSHARGWPLLVCHDVTGRHRGRFGAGRGGIAGGILIIIASLAVAAGLTLPRGASAAFTSAASRSAAFTTASVVPAPTSTQTIKQGIDVSGAAGTNPVTNWASVQAAGMSFAGVQAWQGETISNPFFSAQVSGALAAGLQVIPYVFANPEGLNDDGFTGTQQFDKAWAAISGVPGHPYQAGSWLPVTLDLETDTVNNRPECYGKSQADMITWIQQFVDEAKAKTGVAPLIYVLPDWWRDCTGNSAQFTADPLWVPGYGVTSPAIPGGSWSGYSFWQSSNSATVNGVTGMVDLDQEAGLSVKPANVTTVAGAPAALRVSTAGPDVSAGYRATVKFSGLAPGMSADSTGLITGWPYMPGTYKITVSAADGLGGAAGGTFTWGISAASASTGTAGRIQQHGGSDKCLDDPGSRTADASPIDLATCTGKANQQWTVMQDGTIRVLGHCLTASGAHLLLYSCTHSIAEEWRAGTDGSLVTARYGTCLNGPTGAVANGARPTFAACTGSTATTAQHWNIPVGPVVSGTANRCMGVSGSAVQLITCANSTAQHWLIASSAQIAVQSNGQCLTEGGTTAGSALAIAKCANAAGQHWTLVAGATIAVEIKSTASGLCVTTSGSASGSKLVLGACSTALASTWRVA
jgi:GH25 family lysozyme M1 (1,4-beta-N-acetylmuramidase)